MRKIGFSYIGLLGLLLFGAVNANAALFANSVNFSGTGTFMGEDYLELPGTGPEYTFDYSHQVTFSPPAATITSAEIALTHRNNSDNPGELWFLCGDSCFPLGELTRSTGEGWVTEAFAIPSSLYSTVQGGEWTLQLTLKETTTGTDKLWIDKSMLSGTYAPVPIPGAAWLLGSGLMGIAGVRRRFCKA